MFEQTILNSSPRRAAIPLACFLEALIAGGLVLLPLIHSEALGLEELRRRFFIVPTAPPRRATSSGHSALRKPVRSTDPGVLHIPRLIPKTVAPVIEPLEPIEGPVITPAGGGIRDVPGGIHNGVWDGFSSGPPTPPPPLPATRAKQLRIRVGGIVEAAKLLFQPKPEYPPLAKMARIQGTVRLEAVISRDGTIQDLKMLSGHPLLVKAAIEAVSRWHYQPTLLNGEPVEVVTEIDVNFTLRE